MAIIKLDIDPLTISDLQKISAETGKSITDLVNELLKKGALDILYPLHPEEKTEKIIKSS